MKKMKYIALVLLCTIGLSLIFSGCSGSGKLVGIWKVKDKDMLDGDAYRYLPSQMEFFDDGSGTFNIPYYRGSEDVDWSASGSRLKVTCTLVYDFSYSYDISGDELTLTYDDMSVVYVRK